MIFDKVKEYIYTICKWLTYMWYLIKNYIWNYLSVIAIIIFVTIKKATNSILLNAITADGIFFAIDYIVDSFIGAVEKNKSDSYILGWVDSINKRHVVPFFDNLRLKPKSGIFNRYIYFVLLAGCYNILDLLFWGGTTWWLYYALIVTTHPYILDYLLSETRIGLVLDKIYWAFDKMYKDVLFSFLAYCINNICLSVLNKNPQIKSYEIKDFMNEKDQPYTHIGNFIKVFVVMSIIHYLKHIGFYYTRVIEMLYNYGAIIEIKNEYVAADPLEHITDPKEKILYVLETRKLDLLLNRYILRILMKIYTDNNDNTSFMDKFKDKIGYIEIVISKFCAFYSISALLGTSVYSITLSLIILLIQKSQARYYVPRLIGCIMWWFDVNVLCISAICELFELLYNKAMNYVINKAKNKIEDNYQLLIHKNDYNIDILMNTVLLVYYKINPLLPVLWIVNKNKIIYGVLMICGYFSGYYWVHMVLIDLVLYLGVNLYYSDKKVIEIEIIDEFYDKNNRHNLKSKMKRQRSLSLIEPPNYDANINTSQIVNRPESKSEAKPMISQMEKSTITMTMGDKFKNIVIVDDYFSQPLKK